jgi:hypothetical protein
MKFVKKHITVLFLLLATTVLFSSCLKDNETKYSGDFVEMDAAAYNARAAGQTYPILTRVPGYGRPVFTAAQAASGVYPAVPADPTITRTSGQIKFRVNLVGPQRSTDTTVGYTVVSAGTTAVSGTHYTTGNTVVIPANSSFGEITVNVLNPGVSSTTPVTLVLELTGASDLPPSENVKRLGISIAQN